MNLVAGGSKNSKGYTLWYVSNPELYIFELREPGEKYYGVVTEFFAAVAECKAWLEETLPAVEAPDALE